MPQLSFPCQDCGTRVEDTDSPIVVYIVAGLAPMHPVTKAGKGHAEVTDYPMPALVRELLAQPVARMEFCVDCFAKKLDLPMIVPEKKPIEAEQPSDIPSPVAV